jgi:hypothetical protein
MSELPLYPHQVSKARAAAMGEASSADAARHLRLIADLEVRLKPLQGQESPEIRFLHILSSFDDKCPQHGSKNDLTAP